MLLTIQKPKCNQMACRRENPRRRVKPVGAVCWSNGTKPRAVTLIEADTKGARVVIDWKMKTGDELMISFTNHLGLHRTELAQIAWSQALDSSGKTIIGIYYKPRVFQAA